MKQIYKITVLIFVTVLCASGINAQITLRGDFSFPPTKYVETVLDSSKYNVYYEFYYVKDAKKNKKSKKGLTILQIGNKFAKFTDFYQLPEDSILEVHSHLKSITAKEANEILAITYHQVFENKELYRNLENKDIVFQDDIFGTDYEYVIKTPEFKWKLHKDNKIILDYKTKKASVEFSGRKWIAWYAPDIPISLGPYSFGNLPGLILEMYDTDDHYHFTASGIDSKTMRIYKCHKENVIKISQKEFLKAEKSFHARPDLYIDTKNTKGLGNLPKNLPYNPIEFLD